MMLYESENCRLEVISGTFYLHLNESIDAYEGVGDFQVGLSLDSLDDYDLQMVSLAILQYLEDGTSIE